MLWRIAKDEDRLYIMQLTVGVMTFLLTKCRKLHIMQSTARADAPYVSAYAVDSEVVKVTLLNV